MFVEAIIGICYCQVYNDFLLEFYSAHPRALHTIGKSTNKPITLGIRQYQTLKIGLNWLLNAPTRLTVSWTSGADMTHKFGGV